MKCFLVALFAVVPFIANAADARDPRVSINSRMAPAQNRTMITSKNQISTPNISLSTNSMSPSIKDNGTKGQPQQSAPTEEKKDNRAAERMACLNNNIGVGNTFVWASRYSNTGDYATMLEDTENPENNVCFVKVALKSSDSRISLADIPARYFQWGETINCGSWVDESTLEQRILDAKKSGRTWATVGGAVGGAAVGVGSMELFGNRLIGGKVQGQKDESLSSTELLRSQLLTMKNNKDMRYQTYLDDLQKLKTACEKLKAAGGTVPGKCDEFDYDKLLNI